MKYMIVEDEHVAHEVIKDYCNDLPHLSFQVSCYNALEALQYLSKHQVDLIFLDINMPKLKGLDFLRTLTKPPKVIVTTAYQEFALEGYELNVVDYLLKPFSFERFLKAVNKAQSVQGPLVRDTVVQTNAAGQAQTIFLREDKKYSQVNIGEIRYVEAAGNYSKVYVEADTFLVREKISTLLEKLPKNDFLQVHKSFLIAKKYIESIMGNKVVVSGKEIPVGKIYKMNIRDLLSDQRN